MIDHIHHFIDIEQDIFGIVFHTPKGLTTIFCYQSDCYDASRGLPSLDRTLFPPEKIGPKLVVKE